MPVIFIRKGTEDPILLAAQKMEPKIRSAFLKALSQLKDETTIDQIADALKTGDVDKAMAILALNTKFVAVLQGDESYVQSFRAALQSTFAIGGDVASQQMPKELGFKLSFDLKNPETIKFLDSYSFPLIQQLSENTTDAIRDVITEAFQNGGHPYEQARQIKTFIGLTANQAKAVSNYRKALSNSDTLNQALNRSLRDGRFDPAIQRAMRNNAGLSSAQIDRMVARYQERYIQYRAQSIARSESVRASNKGQRALWQQARTKGLLDAEVLRTWIVSGDDRTCDLCDSLDGMEVGLDEEFAPGIEDPGDAHTDCRCGQRLVFPKAA